MLTHKVNLPVLVCSCWLAVDRGKFPCSRHCVGLAGSRSWLTTVVAVLMQRRLRWSAFVWFEDRVIPPPSFPPFLPPIHSALGDDYEEMLSNRLNEVKVQVEDKGHYDLTYEELSFGARTAWRNAPRCVNRIVWRQLEVGRGGGILTSIGHCVSYLSEV